MRSGASSSGTAPPRSAFGCPASRPSNSCRGRCPKRERNHHRRARRGRLRLPLSRSSRPLGGPPKSATRSSAPSSPGRPRQASHEAPNSPRTTGRFDILLSARKCGICRAFFMAETSYTAKDITVLEGLEPVRLRPGMYIGSTGLRGLHHLVYEVVDNSVDEALAGENERIEVTLHPDHSVTVQDWGSGIPVDVMKDQGMSALTVVLTKLHAGGKFGGSGYKVSGGLHGVGLSVVNALSEWLIAEVRRDGKIYRQEFSRGTPTADMAVVGDADKRESGTTISFLPDAEIFEEVELSAETLQQRLRETAFLTRGLKIRLVDERAGGETVEFRYDG